MGYYIFFDESGKITIRDNKYSYYGALGISEKDSKSINEKWIKNGGSRELHFQRFNLTNLDSYLNFTNILLDKSKINIYMVENSKALHIANKLSIDHTKLRELLYIKIPERLIYGILRYLNDSHNIELFIDECDEYDKYDIKSKLEYQLNAQAIYRDKSYFIKDVQQMDSKVNICLQGIDVIIGIISFIVDKKYISYQDEFKEDEFISILNSIEKIDQEILEKSFELKETNKYILLNEEKVNRLYLKYSISKDNKVKNELTQKQYNKITKQLKNELDDLCIFKASYKLDKEKKYVLNIKGNKDKLEKVYRIYDKYNIYTQSSIQKSEYIYRLLDDESKIEKISKIGLFIWEQNSESVKQKNINEYINKFLLFKIKFDVYNKNKLIKNYKNLKNNIDCEMELRLSRNSSKLVERYIKELDIKFK